MAVELHKELLECKGKQTSFGTEVLARFLSVLVLRLGYFSWRHHEVFSIRELSIAYLILYNIKTISMKCTELLKHHYLKETDALIFLKSVLV